MRWRPYHLWFRSLVSTFRFEQCPSFPVYFTPQQMQIKTWILISKWDPKLEFLWLSLQRILRVWRLGADSCVLRCENACSTRIYLDVPAPHGRTHCFQHTRGHLARDANPAMNWLLLVTETKSTSSMNLLTIKDLEILKGAVKSVSYTHLTLPTRRDSCRSRWSPYH